MSIDDAVYQAIEYASRTEKEKNIRRFYEIALSGDAYQMKKYYDSLSYKEQNRINEQIYGLGRYLSDYQ